MKLLVIGSGGREHALAWKLTQSPRVQKVFVAPGNGGTATENGVENVAVTGTAELIAFARKEKILLTVVGPEAPLAAGVVDAFRDAGLKIFGPTPRRGAARSVEGFRQELHGAPQDPDRAAQDLRQRRGSAERSSPSAARRSWSRPTALLPAKAWSSRRASPKRTPRSTRC